MSENSNVVTVGWASRWGFALTGVGIILPFLAELADVTEHLGVDPDLYTKAGFIIGGITILGRMLQQIGKDWNKPRATEPPESDPTADDLGDNGSGQITPGIEV